MPQNLPQLGNPQQQFSRICGQDLFAPIGFGGFVRFMLRIPTRGAPAGARLA